MANRKPSEAASILSVDPPPVILDKLKYLVFEFDSNGREIRMM